MGTSDTAVERQLLTTVSNPLGWDGDDHPGNPDAPRTLVSNPLGWDGDLNNP